MRNLTANHVILIVIISIFYCSDVFSWDNEITHKDLATYSAESSVLSKNRNDYLKNIGFNRALDEVFAWQGKNWTITKWLREGAEHEDAGNLMQGAQGLARYINHFHNPLKAWSAAGLTDLQNGEASVIWAQDRVKQYASFGGDWSWKKARDCFCLALTSTTDQDRQANFAQTFRGLGHQMHLIQDMAVPAHVRNDAHPEDALLGSSYLTGSYYFETWAKKYYVLINAYASAPVFPNVALNISRNGLAPVSQFIDTEKYNGTLPDTSLTWGLSEYTNSNFVSDDTIFTDNFSNSDSHYFPYPRYLGQTQCYEQFDLTYGTNQKRPYWRKKCAGEPVEHFVTVGPLFKYLPTWDLQRLTLKLDGITHYDYVSKLIPRAVGYSTGLLNYFFRGEVEAVNPKSLKDSAGNITGVKLSVRNKTASEALGYGKLVLAYQYKPFGSNDLVYGISSEIPFNQKIASGSVSSEFNFSFISLIPFNAHDVKAVMVYRGILGSEADAVAAKLIKLPGPRGGIIFKNDKHFVYVGLISDADARTLVINSLPGEEIVKAAFDEGSVDVVRLLTVTQAGDQRVWHIVTFTYDKNSGQYIETDKQEVTRINTMPLYRETKYTILPDNGEHFPASCTRDGVMPESPEKIFSISDFFVPHGQDIKFLKKESNTIILGTPFIKKVDCDLTGTFQIWDYSTQTYKNCYSTGRYLEEYTGGGYEEGTYCRITAAATYSSQECGEDFSWNRSGPCYSDEVMAEQIKYSDWKTCGGDWVYDDDYSTYYWLEASLDYGAVAKKMTNPKNNGGSILWQDTPSGPCLLIDPEAKSMTGSFSGKILSENQAVVQSELRQDYIFSNTSITIEPNGTVLNAWPSVLLRQTGAYSLLEFDGNGTVISNRSNFANLPSDKPILLNGKGDGFKISFTTNFEQKSLKFQVGTQYNDQIKDFTGVSSSYYTSLPGLLMDVMVEY